MCTRSSFYTWALRLFRSRRQVIGMYYIIHCWRFQTWVHQVYIHGRFFGLLLDIAYYIEWMILMFPYYPTAVYRHRPQLGQQLCEEVVLRIFFFFLSFVQKRVIIRLNTHCYCRLCFRFPVIFCTCVSDFDCQGVLIWGRFSQLAPTTAFGVSALSIKQEIDPQLSRIVLWHYML